MLRRRTRADGAAPACDSVPRRPLRGSRIQCAEGQTMRMADKITIWVAALVILAFMAVMAYGHTPP